MTGAQTGDFERPTSPQPGEQGERRRKRADGPTAEDVVGTCDWGHCNGDTVALRRDSNDGRWLSVCVRHRRKGCVPVEDVLPADEQWASPFPAFGTQSPGCRACGAPDHPSGCALDLPNIIARAAAAAAQPTGGEADDVFRDPTQKGRQLGVIIASLLDTYKPEGVGIWLNSPNRNLGGRPLDLIAAGDGGRVLAEADRLSGGPTR